MKQTRRKELKTNELSIQLQQLYAWVERNSTFILAGVLGVVAITVICLLIKQRITNKEQAAWSTYYELRDKDVTADAEALERANQLASAWGDDANLGPVVLQLKGSMESRKAMSLGDPKDQDKKLQLLNDSAKTYRDLLERFGSRPQIAAEAHISLASIGESLVVLGQGTVDNVRQEYQRIIEQKPNIYVDLAQQRLAELDARLKPIKIIATRPAETAPALTSAPAASQPTTRLSIDRVNFPGSN